MEQLLGYAMLATVPWALWMRWSLQSKVKAADDWHTADGEIVSSGISRHASGTYDNPNSVYKADIVYEYEAGGRKRQNNKICIGGQMQISMKSKADEYCRRYPEGKKVIVHYNPKNPGQSVLEVREEISWFYLAGAGVLAIVGFMFI